MDKNSSKDQKQQQQQQQNQHHRQLDEAITSSQCINQISSISTTESTRSTTSTEKKATHSEIEKRRRQKMNKHLNELAFHLPGINNKNKKPDKLTILKLAVQHLKSLKASNSLLNDSFICQNFMKPNELQSLVLNESDEFFIVIKCDSSKILFVSESCTNSIGFTSNDLIDKSFFDLTHSSDHKQIKEQLNYQENTNNNSVDSTNNYLTTRKKLYTSGDRRSFLCRIRNCSNETNKNVNQIKQSCVYPEPEFKLAHFVGYLRSDFASKYETNSNSNSIDNGTSNLDDVNDQCSSSTFVSSDQLFPPSQFLNSSTADENNKNITNSNKSNSTTNNSTLHESTQINGHFLLAYAQIRSKVNEVDLQARFITKHDRDGNFIYVDPNVYPILGYLPQQLLSESIFNYVHIDDVQMLKKNYQEAIFKSPSKIKTADYRVRLENNKSFAIIESVIFALKNPFTNSLEYIVSQNKFCSISLITSSSPYIQQSQHQQQQQMQQQKKKLMNSPMNQQPFLNISMPMTPSPEDSQSPEMVKYNEKKIPAVNLRPKNNTSTTTTTNTNSTNNPVNFNQKLKQKETMFQIDSNNNLIIDQSEINSAQMNLLPIVTIEQQQQQQRSSQDSFLSFPTNSNLYNQNLSSQQILFDINDNFNDFLTKNQSGNQSTSSNDNKDQNASSQSSYNLMLKNNSVQENAEMLMEILKNEKNFQTSTSTTNNEKS